MPALAEIKQTVVNYKISLPESIAKPPSECGSCGSEMAPLSYMTRNRISGYDLRSSVPASICSDGGRLDGNGLCGGISFTVGVSDARNRAISEVLEGLKSGRLAVDSGNSRVRNQQVGRQEIQVAPRAS